ncbi:hemolysin BL-binding protein, partial [Pantoea agglomerans]
IATPNGITCSGCGFIKTGRATLTTGTPTFTDGALTGFNVAKGTLTVSGNGLTGADYTDLLAQKINIQGQIATTQLKAIAGSYTYDLASGQATAT